MRPKNVEDVWVAVQSKKFPTVIIGYLYRHPIALAEPFNYVTDVLNYINLRNTSFYLLGDFNDNLLSDRSKLKQIISNAKLVSLVTEPPRITST